MQIKFSADAPQAEVEIEGYRFQRGDVARNAAGDPIEFDAETAAEILRNGWFSELVPAPPQPKADPAKPDPVKPPVAAPNPDDKA